MKKLFYFFIIIILTLQTLANNTIDYDYWARLLQGNYFWAAGKIMKQDIFSYTPTHIWLDHEWGSSVVFSFIQNHIGFYGILFTKILLLFIFFFFIFKTIKLQTSKNNNFLNIILFSLSVYALPTLTQSGLRCHFFTFLFFVIFLYILETVRKKGNKKLLYLLPAIFLIWCNMHGGCVSGLGLIIIYSIGEALNKKPFKNYIFVLLMSLALMFINPYGIDFVKFIFTASTMNRPNITEWISPFLHPVFNFMLIFKLMFLFLTGILIKNIKSIKTDYTKIILLFICMLLSAKNTKSSPFFIITGIIFLYDYILNIFPKKVFKGMEMIFAIFIIVMSIIPIKSFFFLSEQPYKTVEFIRLNKLKGKILSPMEMGSYIAYKLYPNNLIYMDGRYEEVYFDETKRLLDNFYNLKGNVMEIIEKYRPDYIIAPNDALINNFLEKREDYTIIWRDEKNWLYSSNDKLIPMYKRTTNDLDYYIKAAFDRQEN